MVKCRTAETREFSGRFPFRQHYPGVFWFPWGKQGRWGSHASLMTSTGWKGYRGHMFSMFREPSSLAASALQVRVTNSFANPNPNPNPNPFPTPTPNPKPNPNPNPKPNPRSALRR